MRRPPPAPRLDHRRHQGRLCPAARARVGPQRRGVGCGPRLSGRGAVRHRDRGAVRRRVDVPPPDRRLEGGAGRFGRAPGRDRPRRSAGRRAVGHASPGVAGGDGGPGPPLPRTARTGPAAPASARLRPLTTGMWGGCGRHSDHNHPKNGAGPGDENDAEWPGPPATPENVCMAERDRPWLMRTYSRHSTPESSNRLYRTNLAKCQTGLSIAFDLPTQTGYDPDAPEAWGEVGKVGVPVYHLGHMNQLLDGSPQGEMNTSMTINATAAWLLGLYVANAESNGVETSRLRGTTQNDIGKEYLSRGTYIFPPRPSRRLIVDMVAFCSEWIPAWNPINVCSYHLQEAGATPVQEIAYALATAIGVLDAVRDSGQVPEDRFPAVVASISFFVNAGIRFLEETCKMRAVVELWDRIGRDRYGVADDRARRFRYGVQVNSLGLTEAQPENNVQRIVLEMLGVTLSRQARARSIQLPAWNEALGLPRPWDQQWALRMQQVLAFESDLLEYPDLFEGSVVVEGRTAELVESATAELDDVLSLGGVFEAIDSGYLKQALVASHAERR